MSNSAIKLFYNIKEGNPFIINGELGNASFMKVDPTMHKGFNAICLDSQNASYEEGKYYFIPSDTEVSD